MGKRRYQLTLCPLTEVGLFHVLDACPHLQKLDLTSCRGVKVGERRRFFEVCVTALSHGRSLTSLRFRSGRNGKRSNICNWFLIYLSSVH